MTGLMKISTPVKVGSVKPDAECVNGEFISAGVHWFI